MPMKLYGPHDSPSVARVMATFYEKKIDDFELVEIDLKKGEQKDPDYLKIQPFGKVPALKDDDLTIFESRAIARFIAHKYEGQGTPLYGTTPEDKAVVEQWLEVESQNFNGPLSVVVSELKKFGKSIDESKVSAELEKLNSLLDVYQDHLDKNVYLAGDFFSLADLSHLPYLHYIIKIADRGDLLTLHYRPAVWDWWESCSKRRSWTRYAAILRLGY